MKNKKRIVSLKFVEIVVSKIRLAGVFFKREASETVLAAKIFKKMLQKEEVTKEQIEFLKSQSLDLGKALAIIGVQAIPGSSVAIVALEKIAQKNGFTLFPKDQEDPNIKEELKPLDKKNV